VLMIDGKGSSVVEEKVRRKEEEVPSDLWDTGGGWGGYLRTHLWE